jgi:hypothetical protein
LLQFGLDRGDERVALLPDLILSGEQRLPAFAPLRFERTDLFLMRQLLFERSGRSRRAAHFSDLFVEVFDFPLEAYTRLSRIRRAASRILRAADREWSPPRGKGVADLPVNGRWCDERRFPSGLRKRVPFRRIRDDGDDH